MEVLTPDTLDQLTNMNDKKQTPYVDKLTVVIYECYSWGRPRKLSHFAGQKIGSQKLNYSFLAHLRFFLRRSAWKIGINSWLWGIVGNLKSSYRNEDVRLDYISSIAERKRNSGFTSLFSFVPQFCFCNNFVLKMILDNTWIALLSIQLHFK